MRRQHRQLEQKRITIHWPTIPRLKPGPILLALLVLAILLLVLNFILVPHSSAPESRRVSQARTNEINLAVNDVLDQFDIHEQQIAVNDSSVIIRIANDFPFFGFYAMLRETLAEINAEIVDCHKTESGGVLMSIGEKGISVERYVFIKSSRLSRPGGRVAIIIDDLGYSFNPLVRELLTMDVPLTISIIPGLKESGKIADIALLHNKEVLVHLPMEPLYEKYDDAGYTLVVGQDPGITSLRIRQAFAQLPQAVGLNNHQGSRATADEKLMRTVMATLGDMGKFFIDSRTNSKSIAYHIARQMNLKCNYNNFFLDSRDEDEFIADQLDLLAQRARKTGEVIVIGHPRRRTIKALREMLPKLQAMGVTFVHVSELVH